jgi:hypothetical protein
LETAAKLLELLEPVLTVFSKCALQFLDNQADFDSGPGNGDGYDGA